MDNCYRKEVERVSFSFVDWVNVRYEKKKRL